jgi:glycosyltransferase involved in cell wall biosynthesis
MRSLLIIVPDAISAFVEKGEVQPRYYNPCNFFDDVHILMTNGDHPSEDAIQPMVGSARIHFHNIPEDARPMAVADRRRRWQMLDSWAKPAVDIARSIRPALVRLHGGDYNLALALAIKRQLGIPYLVSLHTNPDESPCRRYLSARPEQVAFNDAFEDLERTGLREADLVMPVYRSILTYLARLEVPRIEVCYNVLNRAAIRRKHDYSVGQPVKLVSVGRQYHEKNPRNILRALVDLPGLHLTLIGDGPLHGQLVETVAALGLNDRVSFLPAVPNSQLCAMLADFDLFVVHTEARECNKSVMEAMLAGLPAVHNRRVGRPVPELEKGVVRLVEDTPDGYWCALSELVGDRQGREALGRAGADWAWRTWNPADAEARYKSIYERFLDAPTHKRV